MVYFKFYTIVLFSYSLLPPASKPKMAFRSAHDLTHVSRFSTTFDTLKRDYFSGIQTNLKLMQELYGPDWTMRLYYQIPKESQNWKRLCSIVCQNSNLDICNAENNPMFGKPFY